MDLLMKQGAQLAPKNAAETIAIFRAQVIGPLLTRAFTSHGELAAAIRGLTRIHHRPPTSGVTRTYSEATIERWYYRFKKHGLAGITPRTRSDTGHARELTDAQRDLLVAIRREHPSTSAALILRTLEIDGRLAKNAVSLSTVRRLYAEHGLDRVALRTADGRVRLRWQADRVDALWHADVCHGPAMKIAGRAVPLRIHAILDDHSRYIVAIVATTTEREVEMLSLLVKAMRSTGRRPEALYLDNGATYTGEVLATLCSRLGVGLLHATPHDPQARGKMERFWRRMREEALSHIGQVASLPEVELKLRDWLARYYQGAPHAGILNRTPAARYAEGEKVRVTEDELRAALTVRARRRVRRDTTISVDGTVYEIPLGYLAGQTITVATSLFDGAQPVLELDGKRIALSVVDPTGNNKKRRPPRRPAPEMPKNSVDFAPGRTLGSSSEEDSDDDIF